MKKINSKAQNIIIDATNRSLGRVASEAAVKLRGKHLVSFTPNALPNIVVEIINLSKARFTGTKMEGKTYYKFSGYPGGLKESSLRNEFAKNPAKLFRHMVQRMLPKNKLNSRLLRNLIISKNESQSE